MNKAHIKKIQTDGDCFSVEFAFEKGVNFEKFDFQQIGGIGDEWAKVTIISVKESAPNTGWAFISGDVKLKVGDSITDEEGGDAIKGDAQGEAEAKTFDFTAEKEAIYVDEANDPTSGWSEKLGARK